jgi:hypothetical protein
MLELARCRAIEFALVETMIEVESVRLSTKPMGNHKKAKKLARLNQLGSELAVLEWRGHDE